MSTVPLFPNMADPTILLQLDALYIVLTALTLLHAVSKRGLVSGVAVVAYLFAHTALFEHISLFLGGTHCHASSPVLPMVTPCSSINSVLFYVPWTYTSLEAARRLNLHPMAFPFAVGLLQIGFGAVYEMQGPFNNFWQWPDATGVIANSSVLESWDGYPPLAALAEAKQQREVATIASGVFRVSHHAEDALADRLFEFPLLAPYFHFAFGFGWAAGLALTGSVGSEALPSLKRLIIAGVLSLGLFLPPIWITRGVANAVGVPLTLAVPISLALSFLPIMVYGRQGDNTVANAPKGRDRALFIVSLAMHAFMVTFPFRAAKTTPPGLHALVAGTAAAHLVAQYICCFVVGGAKAKST